MIHGEWKTCVVSSEVSDEVDLGRVYETVIIHIPTISAARVDVRGARKTGGDCPLIWVQEAGNKHAAVTSSSETGDCMWVVRIGGFQYIKLRVYPAPGTAKTFYIMGVRS